MPFYAEECASMLAVTFSGGDKMMRSIVSTCVPSRTGLAPLPFPCSSSGGQGVDVPFVHGRILFPSPVGAAPLALLPRDAGEQRASGSLNHLAPASPLFWHVGLSQSSF